MVTNIYANIVTNSLARLKAIGCPLICFEADGCMAHDHKFKWIGTIKYFDYQPKGDRILLAYAEVIKRYDNPLDLRDGDLGIETAIAANIHRMPGSKLYMILN